MCQHKLDLILPLNKDLLISLISNQTYSIPSSDTVPSICSLLKLMVNRVICIFVNNNKLSFNYKRFFFKKNVSLTEHNIEKLSHQLIIEDYVEPSLLLIVYSLCYMELSENIEFLFKQQTNFKGYIKSSSNKIKSSNPQRVNQQAISYNDCDDRLYPLENEVTLLPARGWSRSNSYNSVTKPFRGSQVNKITSTFPTKRNLTNLKCFYTNATSLVNKWHQFNSVIIYNAFPDIILVTETWFNKSSIIALQNYNIFLKNREHTRGGGVVIYVGMI